MQHENNRDPELSRRLKPLVFTSLTTIMLVFFVSSCSDEMSPPSGESTLEGQLSIYTNIPPQAYFARKIAGKRADINVLVSSGDDPHTYSPSPRQIMELGNADVYFHGVMPFGRQLAETIGDSSVNLRIVDITQGIKFREIEEHSNHNHQHETHDGHHHDEEQRQHDDEGGEGKDPHVWLSPPEIKIQAHNITGILTEIDPENSDYYQTNLQKFISELDKVHEELTVILKPFEGRTFYVHHPSFGYFARTYGLNQKAVETGGRSPSARHIRKLVQQAKRENVKVIFVQPQFEGRSARTIAETIEGAVIRLDPLSENVIENLREIGRQIENALGSND